VPRALGLKAIDSRLKTKLILLVDAPFNKSDFRFRRMPRRKKDGQSHSDHRRGGPCRRGRTHGHGTAVEAGQSGACDGTKRRPTRAGDLLDLHSMHRVIAGCETMYFGMSVSDAYLAATVNVAA
jgi:hypothetical protein